MKMFGPARWMKRIQATAIASTVALSIPTAAIAQNNTIEQSFLDDLYTFLQSQDVIAYSIATEVEADNNSASNAVLAQSICYHMASGGDSRDLYDIFMSATMGGAGSVNSAMYADFEYSAGLYFGSVMNLGSAYYCPQYQAEVVQVLNTL